MPAVMARIESREHYAQADYEYFRDCCLREADPEHYWMVLTLIRHGLHQCQPEPRTDVTQLARAIYPYPAHCRMMIRIIRVDGPEGEAC